MKPLESFKRALSVYTLTLEYLQLSREPGAVMDPLKHGWSRDVLGSMGVRVRTIGTPATDGPMLFIGNHISYVDIPLLMKCVPEISFLAKSEVGNWPVIGYGARCLNTVFVKRSSEGERAAAREAIIEKLRAGHNVAVFPSGTTCLDESKRWRRGAFEIAQATGFPVQPFRIRYSPLRTTAYIGRDFFPLHLFMLARADGAEATIEFHPPVRVTDAVSACEKWRLWSQGSVLIDRGIDKLEPAIPNAQPL